MTTRLRLAFIAALTSVWVSAPFALTFDLTDPDIRQALAIGREDRARAEFEPAYVQHVPHPVVKRVDVITEFRRMVLITAEKKAAGDWLFIHGMRAAKEALKPWRGLVTVAAHLEFSKYVTVPPSQVVLGEAPGHVTAVQRDRRTIPQTLFSDGGHIVIGATLEADYDAASVGQTSRLAIVSLAGQELTRVPIDFALLR